MKTQHNKSTRFHGTVTTLAKYLQVFLLLGLYLVTLPSYAADTKAKKFDHDKTGFVLTGGHTKLACDTCHIRGIFKGIPKRCEGCHANVSQISATKKSATHIQSTSTCDDCHLDTAWKPARVEHASVMGSCKDCHNGVKATGKSDKHVVTTASCDECHGTTAWLPTGFKHSGVTTGCFSCHNGVIAKGKHRDHIQSDNNCENCHQDPTFKSFKVPGGRVDHSTFKTGCVSCHNGTAAKGKSAASPKHISTTDTCESCHNVTTFKPYRVMDHSAATGTCVACHNGTTVLGSGVTIVGKQQAPRPHPQSADTCSDCHKSFTSFVIGSGGGKPDHTNLTNCVSCHNGTVARGKSAAVPPHIAITTDSACESCHNTNSFRPSTRVDHSLVSGTCVSCHTGAITLASGVVIKGKNQGHDTRVGSTSNVCEDCHRSTTSFSGATGKDHTGITGNCVSCHNGTTAKGKLQGPNRSHLLATTNVCEACHNTSSFTTSWRVDHTQVTGTCESCHTGQNFNGVLIVGKNNGRNGKHIATNNACANCHNTTNALFTPNVRFDHGSTTGTCVSCHSGNVSISRGVITGKLTGSNKFHMATTNNCDVCHTVGSTWAITTAANVKHSDVLGTCASCHGGSLAGKTATLKVKTMADDPTPPHFTTSQPCELCHTTTSFRNTVRYVHSSPNYPGDHRTPIACTTCHTTNTGAFVNYPNQAIYKPACAGCHAGRYSPGDHRNATVSTNRNCAGSCHQATPEHSVNQTNF